MVNQSSPLWGGLAGDNNSLESSNRWDKEFLEYARLSCWWVLGLPKRAAAASVQDLTFWDGLQSDIHSQKFYAEVFARLGAHKTSLYMVPRTGVDKLKRTTKRGAALAPPTPPAGTKKKSKKRSQVMYTIRINLIYLTFLLGIVFLSFLLGTCRMLAAYEIGASKLQC